MFNFNDFEESLKRKIKVDKNSLLFLCIGTSDVIWDSVGPVIGSYLKRYISKEFVLGDVQNNIISMHDLMYYYPRIKDRFVIAIDSAMCSENLSGEIFISDKPLVMGLGVNNNKGIVGDMSIKVAVSDSKKITKKYVDNLAKVIAGEIAKFFKEKKGNYVKFVE